MHPITKRGSQHLEFSVAERDWIRGLDPARKPPLPYRTALFVLRAEGTCRAPEPFGPGDYAYRDVADVRAFVGGFAGGE